MTMPAAESGNRPLDQWKTTELKEELKRRKMTTGGLKVDLVRRLEEAMRNEEAEKIEQMDSDVENPNEGVAPENQSLESEISHKNRNPSKGNRDQSVEQQNPSGMDIDNDTQSAGKYSNPDNECAGRVFSSKNSCEEELKPEVSDSRGSGVEAKEERAGSQNLQVSEKVSPVDVGFQVKCESVSTDYVSINEENELKVSLNVDNNVNLESEVVVKRRNTMQESLKYDDDVPQHLGGNDSESLAQQSQADVGPKETGIKHDNDDDGNCILHDQCGSVEVQGGTNSFYEDKVAKYLDQNVGDGDAQTLQNEEKLDVISGSLEVKMEIKNEDEIPVVKSLREDEGSDSMAIDICHDDKEKEDQGNANDVRASGEKRKIEDKEVRLQEPSKRMRRWNVGNNVARDAPKVSITERERPASTTAMQDSPSTIKPMMSRSDLMKIENSQQERIVPPPQKASTNSLRIDRFLRPFTLKAVKELLGKTGTVTNFWMDHIKTHCYVTYSSIDEAVATRDALYNLQWPRNGGRQLIAEYVDPKEVQEKVEGPPQEATPTPGPGPGIPQSHSNSAPPTHMAYKPPIQGVGPGQHAVPPPPLQPLPPPPPLPLLTRDRQPMPPKKVEQPVLTLDDLFKKTKTTPRIYYLPLSEDEVAAKLAARARDNS